MADDTPDLIEVVRKALNTLATTVDESELQPAFESGHAALGALEQRLTEAERERTKPRRPIQAPSFGFET